MSKCQAKKFLAGGRCGGTSGCMTKEDTQGVQTSFSQLLAQREAMDAKMWSSPTPADIPATSEKKEFAIVSVEQKKQLSQQKQKEADIQCLLGDDF